MHRMRTVALILGATLIAAVAVVAVMAATGSGDSQTTYAGGATPTPTPKPDGLGNLSGMYDVQIHNGAKVITFYDCIARQDHDSVTNEVKVTSQCYADIGLSDPNSVLPCLPGEGADANIDGAPDLDGPPPPPPYNVAAPTKMNGYYNPGTDTLTLTSCVPNIGGISGPNIIVDADVPNAKDQLATTGKYTGTVRLYNNMSIEQCEDKNFTGHDPDLELAINLNPIDDRAPCPGNDCEQVPWRTPDDTDYDDDGCTDFEELDKTGAFKCGDDPYNPYDGPLYEDDVSGSYTLTATALRADWDKVPDELVPGAYYSCLADVQQVGDGKADDSVSARVFCYIDIPGVPVNPEAGSDSGDGLSGAAPPGPYADVDDVQTELLGQIDNEANTLDIEGCFEDRDGTGALGHVYVRTEGLNVHTGIGIVNIWLDQTQENCVDGTPDGDPIPAGLEMVRQQLKGDPERDTDADGCSNKSELQDDQSDGGLRDPYNHWDYFNPTNDGLNRVDDILAVVGAYFCDYPACGTYSRTTDRTAVVGANPWNLNKPNGQQRVDDILAAVKSYFHDCGDGTKISDDDDQFDAQTGQ